MRGIQCRSASLVFIQRLVDIQKKTVCGWLCSNSTELSMQLYCLGNYFLQVY